VQQLRSAMCALGEACIACVMLLGPPNASYSQVTLPEPVLTECWLVTTEINNFITPAQSAVAGHVPDNNEFPKAEGQRPGEDNGHNDDCKFHRAAMRMFLWLTARQDDRSNDSYVFRSNDLFHDIVPGASRGPPSILRGAKGLPPSAPSPSPVLTATITQAGPGGRSVVFDDTGHMYDGVCPLWAKFTSNGPFLDIQSFQPARDGARIEVRAHGRRLVFQNDPNGQDTTSGPKLFALGPTEIALSGERVTVNGTPLPLGAGGRVIYCGPAQADRHVLMTGDRRLVYYGIRINDVFKRLSDAAKAGTISHPTVFPSTKAEVEALEKQTGVPIAGKNALTVAIKTSWIDVCAGIAYDNCAQQREEHQKKYLTLDASIPTYKAPPNHPNTVLLREIKKKQTTLALLGMHLAFTVPGFPGMLWSTFEHINNARNVRYSYWDPSYQKQWQKEDGTGKGLLAGSATSCREDNVSEANRPRMIMKGDNIKTVTEETTIGPTNVCRKSPWGTFQPSEIEDYLIRNPTMIALNGSLLKAFEKRAPADVRKNYILVGTTWWPGKEMPSGDNREHHGANSLANSTMETFLQNEKTNCLTCHRDETPMAPLLNVSHIWRQLHPPPPGRQRLGH
jgi:hypothetical protein